MFKKDINNMNKEELVKELQNLRDSRRKGYTIVPKTKKQNNPFANIPEDIAEKILELLKEKKGE